MATEFVVVGVYSVAAREPCHLVEVEIRGVGDFDFGTITQEMPGAPREDWQAAYDEQKLSGDDASSRWAFFFHYLDTRRPLLTPFGAIDLPPVSLMPERLARVRYEPP